MFRRVDRCLQRIEAKCCSVHVLFFITSHIDIIAEMQFKNKKKKYTVYGNKWYLHLHILLLECISLVNIHKKKIYTQKMNTHLQEMYHVYISFNYFIININIFI